MGRRNFHRLSKVGFGHHAADILQKGHERQSIAIGSWEIEWFKKCNLGTENTAGYFHDKSILVQVMTWCHQTPSHYLNQHWRISMASLGHNQLMGSKDDICCIHSVVLYYTMWFDNIGNTNSDCSISIRIITCLYISNVMGDGRVWEHKA